MKILVIDNYDSFTYNLVHIIRHLGYGNVMKIYRNDQIRIEEVKGYDKILFSPGPGIPDEAGIMKDVISEYGASKSMFGVCLGHQAIGEVFGGELFNMTEVRHGVTTTISVSDVNEVLFRKMPQKFTACLYHSWAVVSDSIPEELVVTARDEIGTVMGLAHRTYDIRGVQFHPESILTEGGIQMVENWLND
ncbi:anthranilate synthase component II [Fulvivirga sedimenti]|uniref:Aminodeoxychorismate/anthranilate synthase component II n=1 Tax=Fulvivirga sedimenti TaxID=2879465 RepID=A0A9X1HP37_9BACT|nr:aminodeoxychorismate/anthranilate synthase component II [Fulvivirga sedimenti]MCA6073582.1 aminodeoxychorismate/anthranilate synthase component II [Fulvivirga sedimenti]